MIVNVNMCASMFDETLHVMKFSAIAKKVIDLNNYDDDDNVDDDDFDNYDDDDDGDKAIPVSLKLTYIKFSTQLLY